MEGDNNLIKPQPRNRRLIYTLQAKQIPSASVNVDEVARIYMESKINRIQEWSVVFLLVGGGKIEWIFSSEKKMVDVYEKILDRFAIKI